jgi:hypothetical protein
MTIAGSNILGLSIFLSITQVSDDQRGAEQP